MPTSLRLSNGRCTLVDDDDYAWLSRWRMALTAAGYAIRHSQANGQAHLHYCTANCWPRPQTRSSITSTATGAPTGAPTLRLVTSPRIQWNRCVPDGSAYKGVSWHRHKRRWQVRIQANGGASAGLLLRP